MVVWMQYVWLRVMLLLATRGWAMFQDDVLPTAETTEQDGGSETTSPLPTPPRRNRSPHEPPHESMFEDDTRAPEEADGHEEDDTRAPEEEDTQEEGDTQEEEEEEGLDGQQESPKKKKPSRGTSSHVACVICYYTHISCHHVY